MDEYTSDDLQAALPPIASLISKSEKAQQRLAPGTWQHAMLRDNLKALRIASSLMEERPNYAPDVTQGGLQEALQALASMIGRTEKVLVKFPPGSSQHTLLRNRLNALRIAETLVRAASARA